ncbi:MAG: hypothetical protein QM715_20220 [Nibricoccus sp.]
MKSLMKLVLALALLTSLLKAQDTKLDGYLRSGKLQDGLNAFAKPANDGERFSLAVLQTLQGLQQFGDGAGKLGIKQSLGRNLPFFRILPATQPAGTPTEVATPEKVRALFTNLRESLKKANATLAKVGDSDFKVQVNLSQAYLENNAGTPGMPLAESLGRIMGLNAASEQDIVVNFDSADAVWLKGYTHLLTGMLEILMAYDWSPVWNQMAYLLFASPNPMPPLAKYAVSGQGQGPSDWADMIAAVHDMRLELKDAEAFKRALAEFRSMIACSRLCWTRIQAETDDDQEWLPSPKQKGPRGARITQEQIDGWTAVLNELDAILAGKKLLPHWRIINGMGINVARLVQNPPKFDLVLLVQGSAFVPYIEGGDVSSSTRWRQLVAPFGPGGFMSFALWSN